MISSLNRIIKLSTPSSKATTPLISRGTDKRRGNKCSVHGPLGRNPIQFKQLKYKLQLKSKRVTAQPETKAKKNSTLRQATKKSSRPTVLWASMRSSSRLETDRPSLHPSLDRPEEIRKNALCRQTSRNKGLLNHRSRKCIKLKPSEGTLKHLR